VDAAVKIIGKGRARRADVEAIVEKMSKMCDLANRARSSKSKNQKQFAKQYSAALRKVIAMTRKAPTDFRPPQPLLRVSAPQLSIDKELFDHDHLLRHLALLKWISESWEKSKLGKPKPDAYEKRLAAKAALHLLKMHDIDPTTTKAGAFCKLAAVLYGDKSAYLQHHCRASLSRAQIQVKNVPGFALARGSYKGCPFYNKESQPHVKDRNRMARGRADRGLFRRHRHDNLAVGARPEAYLSRVDRHSWPKVLEPRRYRRVDAPHGHRQGERGRPASGIYA
jgi:hypothetical protein